MAKCTWYAYRSIGNFISNSMVCVSRSFDVILGVNKGHCGVKNRKYGQMYIKCIWIDSKFYSDSNDVHVKVTRGHLRGQKDHFEVQKGHFEVKNLKHSQVHVIYIWIDLKFGFKFNDVHLKVSRGDLRGKKGHFGVVNLKHDQIHVICIWFDSKLYFDSNKVIIMVIQGHWKDQKRSYWTRQKNEFINLDPRI